MLVPTGPTAPQVRTKLLSPASAQHFATLPCRNHRHGREFDVCQTPSTEGNLFIPWPVACRADQLNPHKLQGRVPRRSHRVARSLRARKDRITVLAETSSHWSDTTATFPGQPTNVATRAIWAPAEIALVCFTWSACQAQQRGAMTRASVPRPKSARCNAIGCRTRPRDVSPGDRVGCWPGHRGSGKTQGSSGHVREGASTDHLWARAAAGPATAPAGHPPRPSSDRAAPDLTTAHAHGAAPDGRRPRARRPWSRGSGAPAPRPPGSPPPGPPTWPPEWRR